MNSSIQNNQEIVDMFNTAEVVDKSTMYLLVPRIKQADDNSKRKPKQIRRPNALNKANSLRRLIFPDRNEQVHRVPMQHARVISFTQYAQQKLHVTFETRAV